MTSKVLTPEMGPVTHGVFAEAGQEEEEPVEEEAASNNGSEKAAPKITDILTSFKHVYVK
jgi:hypothetical protein